MLLPSCLLLLALSGLASTQGVQPATNLHTFSVDKRRVSYVFGASPTSGATYKVTFTPQRAGIPQPPTETFTSAGFRTKSGLIPDVTYRLQVVAVLNGEESAAISKDFTTLPDVPTGPPQDLRIAHRNNISITLTWRDPAPDRINDRDGITRFVVRRNGQQVANVTGRNYTITGLSVATSYNFEVLAINEQGIAPNNYAAHLTASTASGVPNPPTLRVVLPRFSNTYLVWKDPEPFVGEIIGVQIHYLIDCIPQNIQELGSGVRQFSVSGIKGSAGKIHSISLRAKTAAGCGTFSAPLEFTFRPIVEVEVTAVGCNTLKVSYTVNPLPGCGNKATLKSLVVKYRPILGAGITGTRSVVLNGTATEGVLCLSGLSRDTPYQVTYSVEVDVGFQTTLPPDLSEPVELFTGRTCDQQQQCQENSRPRTITTASPATSCTTQPPPTCTTPAPTTTSTTQTPTPSSTRMTSTGTTMPIPTTPPPQGLQPASNLQTFNVGKRRVSYTFSASPTSGATYKATFAPQREGIPQPQTETFDNAGFRTTSGLIPDVTYRLQVVAVLNGEESAAISVNFTTLPDVPSGPPQGLAVARRNSTSITLTWRDPAPDRINDRDGITGFVVRRSGQRVATVTGRSYTFTGLSVATSYNFEVLAINEQGTAPNNHAAQLTASTASGVPNPPSLRVVLPRFSNTYLVWRDPEPFVGDIIGVQIHYLIDGVLQNIQELGSGVRQFSVSGIKGSTGKTHSISLQARTTAGWGPNSSTPLVFTFRPIVEVEVTAVGCNTLKVSYTVNPLPGGGNEATLRSLVVKYRPILGAGSTGTRSVALNARATEGVLCLSGLPRDTGYRVTYSVEVDVGFQTTLPSDLSEPVELLTGRTCDQQQQCQESSRPRTITTAPPATSCPKSTTTTPSIKPSTATPSTRTPTTTPSTRTPTTTPSTRTPTTTPSIKPSPATPTTRTPPSTASIKPTPTTLHPDGKCLNEKDSVWKFYWKVTKPGSNVSVDCVENKSWLGMACRTCRADDEWDSVNPIACESEAGRLVRMKINDFVNEFNDSSSPLSDEERNRIQCISKDLNTAVQTPTEDDKPIFPQDLMTVATFLKVVADLGENNGLFSAESNETEEVIADILSKVIDEDNAPAFEAFVQKSSSCDPEDNRMATPATTILQSMERVAIGIAKTLSINKNFSTVSRPNLAMNAQWLSLNSLTGVVFPGPGVTLPSFRKPERLPQIYFPPSFLLAARGIQMPSENDSVVVVNMVMNNMENYLPSDVVELEVNLEGEAEGTFPASRVLSSQISGYDGREVDSSETVEMIFPINEKAQNLPVPSGRVKQFRCAFFNFSGGVKQTGGWSYRGMESDVINGTHVQCRSSHLTSFVVLVSTVPRSAAPPLNYIIYIGCIISFLCLVACIIFFLFLRKELFQKLHNFVHFNLCIALSLGLLLCITGIQTATGNIIACKVVTALLHYFFLATFTWTLCEAILICFLLVKVLGANNKKWIFLYLALGWALPIPVVVITGGARHDYYMIRTSFDESHPHYDNVKACWLPRENGMIYAFIVPLAIIIAANAVLLTVSLLLLVKAQCGMTSKVKWDEKRRKNMNTSKYLLMTNVILVPLLGFTWIVGLFAVGEEKKLSAYLFVFANILQGLLIFLLYVMIHEKMCGMIKGTVTKSRKRVMLGTGSGSTKGGTQSSKSVWVDNSATSGSCAAEMKTAIEFEEKNKDEDGASIQEGEDVDMSVCN